VDARDDFSGRTVFYFSDWHCFSPVSLVGCRREIRRQWLFGKEGPAIVNKVDNRARKANTLDDPFAIGHQKPCSER
jgi:hypothetical protein